jgi:condensin complex subunit 2
MPASIAREPLGGVDMNVADATKPSSSAKSSAFNAAAGKLGPRLNDNQLSSLYTECISLAATNKINAKNTWSLNLIDNISDVVNSHTDGGGSGASLGGASNDKSNGNGGGRRRHTPDQATLNFQKASCTLEAAAKIYSYRVDSVHKETCS